MTKGDILLIPFPFTDLTGMKLRPALVLAETNTDYTVAFITTQLHWQEVTDTLIEPDLLNGIKRPSLIRLSKIATIEKTLAAGLLGHIGDDVKTQINNNLRKIFDL
ncbi:type II toxin-antitoxin system PemK/MazF family toxin [uncultured Mucilaginibacter sp.]|uniref:type II toxin-antitoxin system PemK/MazF family toxin n=1 Tax=uncultured Mucilaginibacter sp. TaxID=797541 RepID=UPI0025E0340F|nr:type II toxin-antitoxin system PemK/MazF family toxin [uncultured Mucilaginibacter sp.]